MATLDFLFSNQPPQTLMAPSTSEGSLPGWYQDVWKSQILKANQIAAEPYQQYQGPRIAQPSERTRKAMDFASTAYSNPENFNKYLSPYIGGVVDRIAELGNRNLMENILPKINTNFTSAGQPFSMREGEFTNRAIRDTQGEIMGAQAGALQSAFDSAMKNFMAGTENEYKLLAGAGDYETNLNQRNLDLAYQDFQAQRDYPLKQLDIMQSMLKGYSPLAQVTATKTAYEPVGMTPQQASPLSQVLGTLQ